MTLGLKLGRLLDVWDMLKLGINGIRMALYVSIGRGFFHRTLNW